MSLKFNLVMLHYNFNAKNNSLWLNDKRILLYKLIKVISLYETYSLLIQKIKFLNS